MDVLAPLRRSPATTAIFLDFDGTLSPIVMDAAEARPLAGVEEVLSSLAARYALVAVVSGRPISFLRAHLPAGVDQHGLYGLEYIVGGLPGCHPDAEEWRSTVDGLATAARDSAPRGLDVEHKGLSLTLHFRRHDQVAKDARRWATDAAQRTGLSLRPARMSIELHPPVAVDKGTVVQARVAGMTAVIYIGDDAGDLPAFEALDRLRQDGVATLKVAVRSDESPPELMSGADVEVDGPEGVLGLLRELLL